MTTILFPKLAVLSILAVLMANVAEGAAQGGTGAATREVNLPQPPSAGAISLEEALAQRRSVREFVPGALTLEIVSRLAWAAQGVTAPERRTTPSAGATYPLEVYVVAGNVDGLAAGVYRYRPYRHRLKAMAVGDLRVPLAAAVGQQWISNAAMVVVFTAEFERTTTRYSKRGERYVHMEAGHAAQNLLLQAAALGLGATPVGAFNDAEISRLLRLPAGETPLYIIPVGRVSR